MSKHRLSVDIEDEEHKYLKMCCAKLGTTIKEFVLKATIEAVDAWEDTWMLERWEKDGTREEINRELSDPSRIVYALEKENGEFVYRKTTFQEVINHRSLDAI